MAKFRTVNTRFWSDGYIENLDPSEKLLYLYFLTNPNTDICGIYELSLRDMAFHTGFDKDMLLKILARFKHEDRIYYFDGWVVIKNFIKNQIINPKVKMGMERSLKSVPKKVWLEIVKVQTLREVYDSLSIDYASLSHPNLNLNSNSNLNSNGESENKNYPQPVDNSRRYSGGPTPIGDIIKNQ